MATNFDSNPPLSVVISNPATPSSGDPCRFGKLTGVALIDEGDSIALETTLDIAEKVWDLSVDDNLGGTIAVGDPIYYHDSQTGTPATSLNNDPTGAQAFFGIALDTVAADATTTIRVLHSSAQSAEFKVEEFQLAGGAAGAHTVTGIALGDRLIAVQHWSTAAAIATVADLTSEFSITAADTIDNTAGTATTSDQLIVFYEDRT
jgi:predicted RecA/RadA family phage recombinase